MQMIAATCDGDVIVQETEGLLFRGQSRRLASFPTQFNSVITNWRQFSAPSVCECAINAVPPKIQHSLWQSVTVSGKASS